ncbi:hypothetical protein [Dactylosporangium sp. NPDC050588]|uniref:DUF7674 family protein n=1 Tax=Dactylosporangium sp. NPDC050588 TaxID=3157211 RepID=UPI00340F959F
MTTATEFIQALVNRFPALRPDYDDHVEDMGELLPHVIFGIGEGFTDRIVNAYLQEDDTLGWRSVLDFFDEYFDRGDRDVDEVLVTSFLDMLPWPNQPGHGLVDQLPRRLRTRFNLLRPAA